MLAQAAGPDALPRIERLWTQDGDTVARDEEVDVVSGLQGASRDE
jgi:hypothetical protein